MPIFYFWQKILFKLTAGVMISLIMIVSVPAQALDADYKPGSARFYFAPDFATLTDPEKLALEIMIDPAKQAFNVVYFNLSFDPTLLVFDKAEYGDSFCELSALEIIDQAAGSYLAACGTTRRDLATTSPVVRLTFIKTAAGMAKFGFAEALILAADGYGTPLDLAADTHYLEILTTSE